MNFHSFFSRVSCDFSVASFTGTDPRSKISPWQNQEKKRDTTFTVDFGVKVDWRKF